jgi:hypothetical protein
MRLILVMKVLLVKCQFEINKLVAPSPLRGGVVLSLHYKLKRPANYKNLFLLEPCLTCL